MCNACGFVCCAMDCFEGCGCDCEYDECEGRCEVCGKRDSVCSCNFDQWDEAADPKEDETP